MKDWARGWQLQYRFVDVVARHEMRIKILDKGNGGLGCDFSGYTGVYG